MAELELPERVYGVSCLFSVDSRKEADTGLAGIPTIIKPFFGDQAFWSERVESLNVGSAIRKLTSESLAEALKKATTDEKQIAKAKIVGEMIRKVSK